MLTGMAHEALANHFGRSPDVIARAPGRVNLIGEHTDYEGGLALPFAIDRDVRVALGAVDTLRVESRLADKRF